MSTSMIALVAVLFIALTTSTVCLIAVLKYLKIRRRYSKIIDVELEVEKAKTELDRVTREKEKLTADNAEKRETLSKGYAAAKSVFDKLQREITLLEENIEDISFGLYKPHFDFDSSDDYRNELNGIRAEQKGLVRQGQAVVCKIEWTVGGSKKEGVRMQKQYMKLMLRAFNGECDAAVAKVTWNNMIRMEERIRKAFNVLNKLGGVMQIYITEEFLDLKLAELRLRFETEQKKREETEEQRLIKEQMREEEKARREAERARLEAEKEEMLYEEALKKARAEVAEATDDEVDALNEKLKMLEERLAEAQQMKERAKSMAELTRSGHVYVISNIGSFGDDVFKIGMTRRLDPQDRVKELGDASVPFSFDVHAMVYTKDAPTLENQFHKFFDERRINLVNLRKEFFAVSFHEIEEFVKTTGLEIQLTKLAEAREFRETLALKDERQRTKEKAVTSSKEFPDQI